MKIEIGTKDKCLWCGNDIHWDGEKWVHTGDAYRHLAEPRGDYGK